MNAATYAAELQLASSDLEQGRLYLQQTRDCLVGATRNLSDAQWKFKPAPDQWSIAEIFEHLVMTQDFILGPICAQLAQAPPASPEQDYEQVDAIVVNQLPARLSRFQAPDAI